MSAEAQGRPHGRYASVRSFDRRMVVHALIGGLVLASWLTLWVWAESPYARYIDHGRWTEIGLAAAICRAIPAGDILVPGFLYASGWVLMVAAMMLPTTLPIIEIFRRITDGRADAGRLLGLVVVGYFVAWFGFGLAAHAFDYLLHEIADGIAWLIANGWAIGVAVISGAGVFQFTSLKYRCLDKCRTPLGFVIERWRGRSPSREALRLGFDHGVFCIGCCWALMLLMFVVGTGNLGWMLALAAVMAAEKNLPGGRRLSTPLGVALIAWASFIFFMNILPSSV